MKNAKKKKKKKKKNCISHNKMKNKNIAVNFKAYLIASRELFHINDSSDMTDMIDHLLC